MITAMMVDEDPPDEPRVPVNFRLHPSERDQVDAIAAREQRSRSQMIRYWVIEGIEHHERES
jgi:hypothetical protein